MTVEQDEFLEKLYLDLSVRENNDHVGTGLGGSSSEFFFLLTHSVKVVPTTDDLSSFEKIGSDEIVLHLALNPNLKQVRQELTNYFNGCPDKLTLEKGQLVDVAFLERHQNKGENIRLLISLIKECNVFVQLIDLKAEKLKSAYSIYEQETKTIEVHFLKEMKLPRDIFDNVSNDQFYEMMKKHPVWGVQMATALELLQQTTADTIDPEDLNRLKSIASYPSFLATFAIRSIIGIERIVALNLDEFETGKILMSVCKKI